MNDSSNHIAVSSIYSLSIETSVSVIPTSRLGLSETVRLGNKGIDLGRLVVVPSMAAVSTSKSAAETDSSIHRSIGRFVAELKTK